MLNKLKNYLAKKLLPYAEITPPKFETTSLDVEKLACEYSVNREICGGFIPEIVYKREIARQLANELIPYIRFETTEDIYTDSIRYRGVIRIVKER